MCTLVIRMQKRILLFINPPFDKWRVHFYGHFNGIQLEVGEQSKAVYEVSILVSLHFFLALLSERGGEQREQRVPRRGGALPQSHRQQLLFRVRRPRRRDAPSAPVHDGGRSTAGLGQEEEKGAAPALHNEGVSLPTLASFISLFFYSRSGEGDSRNFLKMRK